VGQALNLGAAERQNKLSAQQARAQAGATKSAGMMEAGGAIGAAAIVAI